MTVTRRIRALSIRRRAALLCGAGAVFLASCSMAPPTDGGGQTLAPPAGGSVWAGGAQGGGVAPAPQPPQPVRPPTTRFGAAQVRTPPVEGDTLFGFAYCPPGFLRGPREGSGYTSRVATLPEITFPVAFDPKTEGVVLNSQALYPGGAQFGSGNASDERNYRYPSYDTFCERGGRGRRTNVNCPGGEGHQGVDIRAGSVFADAATTQGQPDVWQVRSAFDGTVTYAGGHQVRITSRGGVYEAVYMHLNVDDVAALRARIGADRGARAIARGAAFARVSEFARVRRPAGCQKGAAGCRLVLERATTPHLHFEIRTKALVKTHLPVYATVMDAYRRELGLPSLRQNDELTLDPEREVAQACVKALP